MDQDEYTGPIRDDIDRRQRRHQEILVRRANTTYSWLTKRWGIKCELYRPNKVDTTYQEYDESLGYELEPYHIGYVWLPSAFKDRNTSSEQVIDIFLDGQTLTLSAEVDVVRNTLVVPQWAESMGVDKRGNYRISSVRERAVSAMYRVADIVPSAYNVMNAISDEQREELSSVVPSRDVNQRPDQTYFKDPKLQVIPTRPRIITND